MPGIRFAKLLSRLLKGSDKQEQVTNFIVNDW